MPALKSTNAELLSLTKNYKPTCQACGHWANVTAKALLHTLLTTIMYSFANHHQKYITIVFCCLVKVYLMEVNMASTPASPPLPYVRHDVPLMCHWELRTAGWEVGRTLRAHEARQDQAAQREEAFLCIHEYHSGERQTKNKEHRKLMAFLYLRGHRGRGCYLTSTRRRLQSKKRKCCYWYSWYQEMELEISSV